MRKSIRLNDGITNVDKIDDLDAESILLELAYQKQVHLNGVYSEAGSKYHSLIAIQIPNSVLGKNCRARIVEFFQKKGITVEKSQTSSLTMLSL